MDLNGHTGYQLRLPCAGFDSPIEGIDPRLLEPTACGKGATWKKTSKMKKGRPMRKTICSATAAILMVAAIPVEAGAFPLATTGSGYVGVTLIAGGCGPAFHRGPYGGCVRNYWGPRPYAYGWHRCWVRETPWGPRRVCR
jgi:hypothetical protein